MAIRLQMRSTSCSRWLEKKGQSCCFKPPHILSKLFDVHFRDLIGSPRVARSTISATAFTRPGSCSAFAFRPPPGRRCRPAAGGTRPGRIPPRPNVIASLPAHNRLARSSKHPFNRLYFSRITRCISARTLRYNRPSFLPPCQSDPSICWATFPDNCSAFIAQPAPPCSALSSH